jgi:spore coat polysaccharide biosynthesis protein SpsF
VVLAILQARISSTRLPEKVLKQILGKPMLQHQIERLFAVKRIDKLIVATSDDPSDNPLEELCSKLGVTCFRGSLNDVLDRYYQAAKPWNCEHVVRLTGDCPLTDPELIDEIIQFHLDNGYDYTSNTFEPTFPDGLDVEVFRFRALETAWREAAMTSQREHVTPFIWQQPDRFNIAIFKNDTDLSYLRWTVDEQQDFELIKAIYEALYPRNPMFNMAQILEYLRENPELMHLNDAFRRNEGYEKSLQEDKLWVKH